MYIRVCYKLKPSTEKKRQTIIYIKKNIQNKTNNYKKKFKKFIFYSSKSLAYQKKLLELCACERDSKTL
jgi:hypothetical protein